MGSDSDSEPNTTAATYWSVTMNMIFSFLMLVSAIVKWMCECIYLPYRSVILSAVTYTASSVFSVFYHGITIGHTFSSFKQYTCIILQ